MDLFKAVVCLQSVGLLQQVDKPQGSNLAADGVSAAEAISIVMRSSVLENGIDIYSWRQLVF